MYGRIETFQFSDGAILTAAEMEANAVAAASTSGDDVIGGGPNDDILDGGAGNDLLSGADGNDTYVFGRGYGQDTIDEDTGTWGELDDVVTFKSYVATTDIEFDRVGNDLILKVLGTSDQLTIKDQFRSSDSSSVFGINRVERFVFADGTSWTADDVDLMMLASQKTSGDDNVSGYTTNDVLDGGAGNDTLSGRDGNDTYVFGRGYGQDVIDEDSGTWGELDDGVAFRADVAPSDLKLQRSGRDLVILVAGTTDQLTIKDQFWSADSSSIFGTNRIERFTFSDGTFWGAEEVDLRVLLESQTDSNDIVVGYTSNDVLTGGVGDDRLSGGEGDDTYIFEPDFGRDIIDEDSGTWGDLNDQVVFKAGILPADVLLERDGNDLVIRVAGTSAQLRITNQLLSVDSASIGGADRIESFSFADGTVWSAKDVERILLSGTPAADTLTGFDSEDVLDGKGGNDMLRGGTANDTYIYSRGHGNDTIVEAGNGGTLDQLVLTDIASSQVSLVREGDHLMIVVAEQPTGAGNGATIRVSGQFTGSSSGIEQIVFSDGVTLTAQQIEAQAIDVWGPNAIVGDASANTLLGTSLDEIIVGKGGDDVLRGNGGSDDYKYASGDGSDTIIESGMGQTDVLTFMDLGRSDVVLSRDLSARNNLVVTIIATGEEITIDNQFYSTSYGIEEMRFADGVVLDRTAMSDQAWLRGTAGNETISGTSVNDTIIGNEGDDVLSGLGGSDTYIYRYGDGSDVISESSSGVLDVLLFTDILSTDVIFSRDLTTRYDLIVNITGTGDTITINNQFLMNYYGLDAIHFANGETIERANLFDLAWYRGTDASETITGTSAGETFIGGEGDDTLSGLSGDDTYIYSSGDGSDFIDDSGSGANNVLKFTDLNVSDLEFSRFNSNIYDLFITDVTTGSTITVDDQFLSTSYGLAKILFADGTFWDRGDVNSAAWIRGTSAAETLSGTSADDTIQGKEGADTINSTTGNDTFVWASGDGDDIIDENGYSTSEIDTLKLTDVTPEDVLLVHIGSDLIVNILPTGEAIEVDQQYYSSTSGYGIEQLEFADGTIWNRSAISASSWVLGDSGNNTMSGTAESDNIDGREGDDVINAGAGADYVVGGTGNDTLNGEAGSDTLDGGNGADTLNGGDDDDTLNGGSGDDILTGGYGDDVFVYASGSGSDTITDFEATPGQNAYSLNGDRIQINITGIDDFDDLSLLASEQNGDTVFNFGNGDALIIQGTLLAALDPDAFTFY